MSRYMSCHLNKTCELLIKTKFIDNLRLIQLINMLCKYSYGYVGIYIENDYFMIKL